MVKVADARGVRVRTAAAAARRRVWRGARRLAAGKVRPRVGERPAGGSAQRRQRGGRGLPGGRRRAAARGRPEPAAASGATRR